MGTRTLAQIQPTASEIALTAYIFGYGGHSLVTPHAALKQLWWTEHRIEAKITKRFVISKLRGQEREFLNRPLLFGEGLTDDTYLDWILTKAKRLFLILTEIGASDQIFGCVDDAWTDEDLPLSLTDVPKLELSFNNDAALNQRFYRTQFTFLLRMLRQGAHIAYGPQEHVPIEYVSTLPPAASIQSWERVHFPDAEDEVFVRRKFELIDRDTGEDHRESFLADIQRAQAFKHAHIASVWASYVSDNTGYILSDFVPEHTLRSFVQHRMPTQFMRIPVIKRPELLCQWMYCLVDAVADLHHVGNLHGSIRPSNILIDADNKIAFADVGYLVTFQRGKKIIKNEEHEYSAPESYVQKSSLTLRLPSASRSSIFSFSRLRKYSISTSSSSSSDSSCAGEWRQSSTYAPRASTSSTVRNFSLPFLPVDQQSFLSSCTTSALTSFISEDDESDSDAVSRSISMSTFSRETYFERPAIRQLLASRPEAGDIYSLGCVLLDLVTFMIKGKLNDFVKFRTSRFCSMESGKSFTDSSFHANAQQVAAWIELLSAESECHENTVFRGMPDLLRLVKSMLMQNALLRPTALQVRDRLIDILTITCGIETLCCAED